MLCAAILGIALPAQAQEILPGAIAMCDGSLTGKTYDLEGLNGIIGGNWNQLGRAYRYTLGSPVNPFTLTYKADKGQLFIEGGGGPKLPLQPFAQAKLADVPLTINNLRRNETSYISQDGTHTVRLSGLDMETLTGCPLETAPSFFWTSQQGERTY
jgi:hypothetical protein